MLRAKGGGKKPSPKLAQGGKKKRKREPEDDDVDYSAGDEGMFDVGNASDNDSVGSAGWGSDGEEGGGGGRGKKAKVVKRTPKGEAMSMGDAMRTALGRHVPSTAQTPILAGVKKNKELEKERVDNKKEKEETKLVAAKQKWFAKERVVPDHADGNYEKMLLKTATKGAVQLFNAVQKQQKQRSGEKVEKKGLTKAPDSMSKGQFLDMLKGKKAPSQEQDEDEEGVDSGDEGGEDGDLFGGGRGRRGGEEDEEEEEEEEEQESENEDEEEEDDEVEWD